MEAVTEKSEGGEPLKSEMAIRCAKAAILISSLKSPPHLRLNADEDNSDTEVMEKEIKDLKLALLMERMKNRKMKLCGLSELVLQLGLLFAFLTFFFMLAFGK